MPVNITVVTDDGKVLPIKTCRYSGVGDAAGDIDGGDFWGVVTEEYPGIKVKEIRLILDKVVEITEDCSHCGRGECSCRHCDVCEMSWPEDESCFTCGNCEDCCTCEKEEEDEEEEEDE